MDREFWLDRWRLNQIGFHQAHYNARLMQHWPALEVPPRRERYSCRCAARAATCCGSRKQGHPVLGIELAAAAIEAFFAEAQLPLITHRQARSPLSVYESAAESTFCCGDFFDLTPHDLVGRRAYSIAARWSRCRRRCARVMPIIC